MNEKGFVFDYSKCVGCHACIVACYNENHTQPPMSWRQVQSQNTLKVPLYGFINLSIACNHCIEAPCLQACPAKAYEKDPITGAIIHHSERCIGCKYCTWACPFDAPKFNSSKGIIEKCTLCNHLLIEGEKPACTMACPTGALSFNNIDVEKKQNAPGLSTNPTFPRVSILNSQITSLIPEMDINVSGYRSEHNISSFIKVESKINAFKEWPLALFTLIIAILIGWIFHLAASSSSENSFSYIYTSIGVVGMTLSTFHLGKPFRAYRSIINMKNSWLSREIVFFTLFFGISLLYLFFYPEKWILYLDSLIGLFTLISVELVYSVTKKSFKTPIHSANTIITAFTFAFMLNGYQSAIVALLVAKAILYLVRHANQSSSISVLALGFFRMIIGLLIPLIVTLTENNIYQHIIIILFIVGEVIDRFEFYKDIYVETPSLLLNRTDL